ncbi:DUF1269 domain-containing protein [Hydrogenophaga sp. RWCD_12]|uniref:DUF1269 domain-containing protein n=1 Tax=Hydrogenophaga sp. RWCD_12 TaxID=3391190 RepID=UPI0039847FCF
MNKMLVAIFDSEVAADAGLHALRRLHSEGDITLYATGVIAKDASGLVSVKSSLDHSNAGAGLGLAVGSLIGLLGGPLGMLIGASTGAVAGSVRDYWVAGVGLDFVEEAERQLKPGKVALIAEVDEEWVTPVDTAMEATGGTVFRRSRSEAVEAQFDHDIEAFKAEIRDLEAESAHASDTVKLRLHIKLEAASVSLGAAVHRAQQQVEMIKGEADAKADSLKAQMNDARSDVHDRIESRVKRVKSGYHARGAKLSHAWSLTKEALSA